jgi:tRNA threonylcarbamoyladenosine biosynthesis protein TsaE
VISKSPEETLKVGELIGEILEPGDIVALIGELGSGKTCLTQGIARGLRVPDQLRVTSPTFTLINEYPGRIPLIHLDTYRLAGSQDLADMGYEEYFFGNNVVVIEWAEKIQDILPDKTIIIKLEYMDESSRRIDFSGDPDRNTILLNALKEGGFQ